MARQRAMAAIHALRTGRLSDILLGVEGVSYISPQPEEVPMTGPRYPVPNETGEKLMRGSDFGSVGASTSYGGWALMCGRRQVRLRDGSPGRSICSSGSWGTTNPLGKSGHVCRALCR